MRLALIAAALVICASPAFAASTARVSGNITVRSGPGSGYAGIGTLPNGTQVMLERCTRSGNWCLVADTGWVNASYLVGWAAKMRATPPDLFGDDIFRHRFGF